MRSTLFFSPWGECLIHMPHEACFLVGRGENPRKYIGIIFSTFMCWILLLVLYIIWVSVFSCLLPHTSAILGFFFLLWLQALFFFFCYCFLAFHCATWNFAHCVLFCSHLLFSDEISLYLHTTFNFRSLSVRDLFTISLFKNLQRANRFKLSNLKRSHKLHVKTY